MRHFLMPDGSLLSCPDDCKNFEADIPVRSAQELSESQFEQELTKRKPAQQQPDYRQLRRAEYPEWQEFADALVEERSGRPQAMLDYLARVAEVKRRHPKPKD